jgi:hypothetical protein
MKAARTLMDRYMALSLDKIEALAPDQASLSSAVKIKASSWQVAAIDATKEFVWGECQGSGSTPYRVCLQISDLGYKCNCPSRKFPCKHSLGLMLHYSKTAQQFATGQLPDWVNDWVTRRRSGGTPKAQTSDSPKASMGAVIAEEPAKERDEKAEARAVQQRERLKAQREEAILGGLDELDRWIEDSVSQGLARFMGEAASRCRTLAQRLVDAKAPALATSVDALPASIMALPEPMRNDALIEALGEYHLLAEAYRRQEKLPDALRHDVRRLVGWTQERQALLDDPETLRVTSIWTVASTHVEVQPDKLRRIETWLIGTQEGKAVPAVLIDFVPVTTGASGASFEAGEVFEGELAFYPSAAPLRAIITSRQGTEPVPVKLPALPLAEALAAYDDIRVAQPWLKQWPITVLQTRCRIAEKSALWLYDDHTSVQILPRVREAALVLGGVELDAVTGLWDGRFFAPSLAETSIGRWLR